MPVPRSSRPLRPSPARARYPSLPPGYPCPLDALALPPFADGGGVLAVVVDGGCVEDTIGGAAVLEAVLRHAPRGGYERLLAGHELLDDGGRAGGPPGVDEAG